MNGQDKQPDPPRLDWRPWVARDTAHALVYPVSFPRLLNKSLAQALGSVILFSRPLNSS
jgi:hypothetical protein